MDKKQGNKASRKGSATRAVMIGLEKDKALKNDIKESGIKRKDRVIKGKAEKVAKLGVNEVHGNGDAARSKTSADKKNADSVKGMRKRKLNADDEIAQSVFSSDRNLSWLRPRKEVPSFQMVELNENDGDRIIGIRIKVYWPDSRKWFAGRIESFNKEKMVHKINYDDGDVEELDLNKERFELEVKASDGFKLKALNSKKGKKDLDDIMISKASMNLESNNVEVEAKGEANKLAQSNEIVESDLRSQQAADNSSGNVHVEKAESMDISENQSTES